MHGIIHFNTVNGKSYCNNSKYCKLSKLLKLRFNTVNGKHCCNQRNIKGWGVQGNNKFQYRKR